MANYDEITLKTPAELTRIQRADDFFYSFCERIITPALHLNYNNLDDSVKDIFFSARVYGGAITTNSIRDILIEAFTNKNSEFVIVTQADLNDLNQLKQPIPKGSRVSGVVPKQNFTKYGIYSNIDASRIIKIEKPKWFQSLKDLFTVQADCLTQIQIYQKVATTIVVNLEVERDDKAQVSITNKMIDGIMRRMANVFSSRRAITAGLFVQQNTKGFNITNPPMELAVQTEKILLSQISLLTGYPLTWLAGDGAKGFNSGESDNEIVYNKHKDLANSYVLPLLNKIQIALGITDRLVKLGINSQDASMVVKNLTDLLMIADSNLLTPEELATIKASIMDAVSDN